MSGGEQMTLAGAIYVFGFIATLGMLCSAGYWLADRFGFLDDPDLLPWEESPGARTDRRRLLEDEIR